jgi:hypothetical protein
MEKKNLILFIISFIFIISCTTETTEDFFEEDLMENKIEKSLPNIKEPSPSEQANENSLEVYINDIKLSNQEAKELQGTSRESISGNYWYDTNTGAWGVIGEGTLGIVQPGLDLGTLSEDASNGDTGIFINGRELNDNDYLALWFMTGIQPIPGRWWLDSLGNIGLEGQPAIANLYYLAQQGYKKTGGFQGSFGGDNFWSNSYLGTAGNEQGGFGYVNTGSTFVCYPGCT